MTFEQWWEIEARDWHAGESLGMKTLAETAWNAGNIQGLGLSGSEGPEFCNGCGELTDASKRHCEFCGYDGKDGKNPV